VAFKKRNIIDLLTEQLVPLSIFFLINILFFFYLSAVWLFSAVLSSPPLLGWWCKYDYIPSQQFCFADWPSSVSYTFFMIAACFGGPLTMMTACNVQILQTFRKRYCNGGKGHTIVLKISKSTAFFG
jgi:hypothetical protein